MKELVSVTKDGVMTKHQKCLLLLNIKQLFLEFKKECPTVKIGFSKLCENSENGSKQSIIVVCTLFVYVSITKMSNY